MVGLQRTWNLARTLSDNLSSCQVPSTTAHVWNWTFTSD